MMHSDDIRHISVQCEGKMISDLETDDLFDSSNSNPSHINDIALSDMMVCETDIKVQEEMYVFSGNIWTITSMSDTEKLTVVFLYPKIMQGIGMRL
jgi:hypothetical protein